jgi:hypothetical protein
MIAMGRFQADSGPEFHDLIVAPDDFDALPNGHCQWWGASW